MIKLGRDIAGGGGNLNSYLVNFEKKFGFRMNRRKQGLLKEKVKGKEVEKSVKIGQNQ